MANSITHKGWRAIGISTALLVVSALIAIGQAQQPSIDAQPSGVVFSKASSAFIIDGTTSKPGVYYLRVTVESSGDVTAREMSSVVSLGVGGGPTPDPGPGPGPLPPLPTESLEDIAYKQAKAVGDDDKTSELSAAFSAIAWKISDGTIKPTEVPKVMDELLVQVLDGDTRYNNMVDALKAKLRVIRPQTKEDNVKAMSEISAGLLKATEKGQIDIERIQRIIQIILTILELLRGT